MSSKVNRRRFLKYAGAGLVAGAAAIGGYYFYNQSSTPATPAPACESPSCWTYVALGDSWTGNICGGKSYVDYYADYIESDLGVKVRVLNEWKADLSTVELLSALRSDQRLRDEISEAKVVTFLIGGADVEGILVNLGVTDIRKALAFWREKYDSVIDEILSLRSNSDTIIRAITEANPWVSVLKKQGIFDQVKPNIAGYFEETVETASQHNIPVARVDLAWNGPNLDEDPAAKGYTCGDVSALKSSVHPNEAGNRVIADVLRKLGYKPLGP